MKKIILYSSFIVFVMSACGQSPETKIHIYSRVTLPGTPPDGDRDNNIFPKTYFIYAEIKKGAKVSVEGYSIDGKYYAAGSFEKVSSPVIITDPAPMTEKKDTLVKKTDSDVYQLIPGKEISREPIDEAEKKLVAENQFVLIVKVDGKLQFVSSSKIKELSPAAMM